MRDEIDIVKFGELLRKSKSFRFRDFEPLDILLKRGEKLGIACSGGADSVFLLLSIISLFGTENLEVLHYNHKARLNAEIDEKYVRKLCDKLGVCLVCGAPDFPPAKHTENEFRKLRGAFFLDRFVSDKLFAIAQGHHAGDAQESLLMRIMRGAGLDGLCAPRALSIAGGGIKFIRPLLNFEKSDMKSILSSCKIDWREDESNGEFDFFRNRVRHILLPQISKISPLPFAECALRTRKLLSEDSDFISYELKKELEKTNADLANPKSLFLSQRILKSRALLRRAVMMIVAKSGLSDGGFRAIAADAFIENIFLNSKNQAKASAGEGFIVFEPHSRNNCGGELSFSKKRKSNMSFCTELKEGENILENGIGKIILKRIALSSDTVRKILDGGVDERRTAFLSADENAKFFACSENSNDSYVPLGAKSKRRVSKMLSAKKISLLKRNDLPRVLICVKSKEPELAWVPNLPPSCEFAVSAKSTFAFELTFIRTI